jgi:hypothetical protein
MFYCFHAYVHMFHCFGYVLDTSALVLYFHYTLQFIFLSCLVSLSLFLSHSRICNICFSGYYCSFCYCNFVRVFASCLFRCCIILLCTYLCHIFVRLPESYYLFHYAQRLTRRPYLFLCLRRQSVTRGMWSQKYL